MGLTCAHTSISGHQLRRRQEDVIVGCHPLWLCCSETPVCIKVRGLQQQTPGVTLSAFASSRLQSGSKCEGPAAADTSDTRWCAPHNNTKMVGATSISCNHGLPGRSCIGSECAEPAVYGLQSALLSLHLGKGAGQAFEPNVANAFRGTYAEDQWCVSMRYISCRSQLYYNKPCIRPWSNGLFKWLTLGAVSKLHLAMFDCFQSSFAREDAEK